MRLLLCLIVFLIGVTEPSTGQVSKGRSVTKNTNKINNANKAMRPPLPGAYQTNEYFPLLKGKRVGIFANHTAMVGSTHLVDTLLRAGVNITKIFGPEHGFRGTADAGEKVNNAIDKQTGINVVSLYGKKRKPSADDLADVDVMLFDIQDVGVRFYTFISSLQDFMEAALEHDKPLIILDRPNPNGFYVDGPVLDTAFKSFVGMQPIPVVYGMTIGEYANFLLGEDLLSKQTMAQWALRNADRILKTGSNSESPMNITVIKCRNYSHKTSYVLPVKPSPNLPDQGSIYWYPSTCFFEGTVLSEGRGTDKPFQVFGHPSLPAHLYSFVPVSKEGAKSPKLENKTCYGWNLSGNDAEILDKIDCRIQIKWLIQAYALYPDKKNFFLGSSKPNAGPNDFFFNKLAGNSELMKQIIEGKTEADIRASWKPKLDAFKLKRKKYLMYPE